MREDPELSDTILKIIADDESYPEVMVVNTIRENNAIKKNFKDISEGKILFHLKMLKERGLIKAEFYSSGMISEGTLIVHINRLTKKGSDYVKYIELPFWKRAIKNPLGIQLIYSICEKIFKQ